MNFFKQAQQFASSANANTDGDSQGADESANLPGGRKAPTNSELMQSGQVLFGAAQGQKVDPTQLAGAASDILGGLAAHGNLDEGTYGKYINQAEDYLDKYSGQGQSGAGEARPAKVNPEDSTDVDSERPPRDDESDAPPRRTADQTDDFNSSDAPARRTGDQTDDYNSSDATARRTADQTDDLNTSDAPARRTADQTDDYNSSDAPTRRSADQTDDYNSSDAPARRTADQTDDYNSAPGRRTADQSDDYQSSADQNTDSAPSTGRRPTSAYDNNEY